MEDFNEHHDDGKPITVILELVNGPLDGTTYVVEDHGQELGDFLEASMALGLYRKSRNGAVGEVLRPSWEGYAENKYCLSDFIIKSAGQSLMSYDRIAHRDHQYVITDRIADGNEVLVRAQYLCGPMVTTEILAGKIRERSELGRWLCV